METTAIDRTATALSATEHALADLWIEVLDGTQSPAVDDDFFALGGDSIAMVTVLARIQEEFDVELPPGAIFSAPSLGELAALIDASKPAAAHA